MSGDFTFLKGNIETIILCSLYNRDKYGYEIARDIKERTENAYEIKQPTLYSYLKRLQEDGLIDSYWGTESNGGRRRYYMLTKYGRQNCVQFISEWEFQRGVLSNLVDGTADTTEVSQEDVTPLFGRRSQRRKRPSTADALQQQEDISSLLDQLDGGVSATDTVVEKTTTDAVEYTVETAALQPTTQVVDESFTTTQQTIVEETVVQTQVQQEEPQTVATNVVTVVEETEDANDAPIDDGNPIPPQTSVEDVRSRYAFRQDDADSFIQDFDRRAQDLTGQTQAADGSYQRVLMGVIGTQLDDASQINTTNDFGNMDIAGRPVQIEQVADTLAQEGIRMRIYNHATANYKPKTLMPVSKVLCATTWITYAVAAIFFGLLIGLSAANGSTVPFIVTLAILTIAPIAMSVVAFVDNGRRNKPDFPYRLVQTVTLILALIVTLVALSISLFGNIQLGNFQEVSTKILIPFGVSILPALFVFVYNAFYKKY